MRQRAYKYRLYPTKDQEVQIAKHFGCARHIYNWALSEKKKHYEDTKQNLSKLELQRRIVASKKDDRLWLKEVNSQSLLAALANLETAYNNFFKGRAKHPKFKSKYNNRQSFQVPQHGRIDFEKNQIHIPKLHWIKSKLHRPFTGKMKTITISKNPSGKYYASVLVETPDINLPTKPITQDKTLGIDVGIGHLLIDSKGNKTENPEFLKQSLSKLAKAQKIFC